MIPRVLFVASEAIPLAKTGGLGDVVSALAAALVEEGIEASIMMPAYPSALAAARGLQAVPGTLSLPGGPAQLWHGQMPDSDVPVVLLQNAALYERPGNPYLDAQGHEFGDNGLRFAALCHAAAAVGLGKTPLPRPDLVHAHDWHAGLTPLLIRRHAGGQVPCVLTIHNLAFQGNFPFSLAPQIGISDDLLGSEGIEFWGQLSFLKAGIRYADLLTTVSDSYAEEILTPEFGCGLEGLLSLRRDSLIPVPNGIDTETWDPATDPLIAAPFSADDLKGKVVCKRVLQQSFGLQTDPFAPLLAIGSRLTGQKMADIALVTLEGILLERPRLQVAVLGTGEAELERQFVALAERFPTRVGVHIGYDEVAAHGLHAGADMLLHGSRFEPFGLTPVYAMRYGTVPIASRVGGLKDSIVDRGAGEEPSEDASGILFDGADAAAMTRAVRRALDSFDHPRVWRALQRCGMQSDHGWSRSAQRYLAVYARLGLSGARPIDRADTSTVEAASGMANTPHSPSAPDAPTEAASAALLDPDGTGEITQKRA